MGFAPKSPPPLPNTLPVLGAGALVVDDPPPNIELGAAGVAVLEVDMLFPNTLPMLGASVFGPPPNMEVDAAGVAVLEVDVLFPNIPPVADLLPPKMLPPRVVNPEGAEVFEVDVPLPNRPPDGAEFAKDWSKQFEETMSLGELTCSVGGLTEDRSPACSPRRVPKGTSRICVSTPRAAAVLWWIKEITHFE